MLKLVGELGIVLEVEAAGEHQVDGSIEVRTCGIETSSTIVVDATAIRLFDTVDELLRSIRFGGVFDNLSRGRSGMRLYGSSRARSWRSCLRGNLTRRSCLGCIVLRTASQENQRRTRHREQAGLPSPH
jgi:hypothetical protein